MDVTIGLLIIALGSLGQSSSYVPITRIKHWNWECFWLVQGIFAWLLFPYLGALLAVPTGASLEIILSVNGWIPFITTLGYGVLWGIGGLTFGLSMRYLGVAMGQSLALGTCSAFGTLIPALLKGDNLFQGKGLILLISVSIAIAGIAIIGYAGSLRSNHMSDGEKSKAVKDFALKKGILIALLAGIMSACFSLGLDAGVPIQEASICLGARGLVALNPVIFVVTIGGFITNAVYCLFQNAKNHTFGQYFSVNGATFANNLLFCMLAGLLWYSQFFALGAGVSFFDPKGLMIAFSWSILMSLNVFFSNLWGLILKEWKGAGVRVIMILILGLLVLTISIIYPQIF